MAGNGKKAWEMAPAQGALPRNIINSHRSWGCGTKSEASRRIGPSLNKVAPQDYFTIPTHALPPPRRETQHITLRRLIKDGRGMLYQYYIVC